MVASCSAVSARSFPARSCLLGFCCQFYHYRFYQLGPDNFCYRTYQFRADNLSARPPVLRRGITGLPRS